jgi:sugar lactone lactonase YvrE
MRVIWFLGALALAMGVRAPGLQERGVRRAVEAPAALVRVTSDGFLKAPPGLPATTGAAFTVAKSAPTMDIHLFESLPNAGPKSLWTDWGDGCVADSGRFYFALGNHLGAEGQSFLYEYDPGNRAVRKVLDIRALLPEPKEKYAAGKVHGRIGQGKDGWLYFPTYWGKVPTDADFQAGFQGSVLLRYDPRSGRGERLGAIVPGQGLPTSLLDPQRMILYGIAVYSGDFVAYDLEARRIRYRGSGDQQEGDRNLMLDAAGNCYFSTKQGALARYSPETNRVALTRAKLPALSRHLPGNEAMGKLGNWKIGKLGNEGQEPEPAWLPVSTGEPRDEGYFLRASTRPAKDGQIFGTTRDGALFAFDPKAETVSDLGPNFLRGEYVAVMDLSPDEKYLYYAPGAHGGATRYGTPVIQFNLATRERKVHAFLNAPLRDRFAYNTGGTYNLKCSPDGSRLYIVCNGANVPMAERRQEQTFGLPALVVLDIPASER